MRRKSSIAIILFALALLLFQHSASANPLLLQLPTETLRPSPTLGGPFIEPVEQVNVRSGPGTDYDLIGVMLAGQPAAAIGRSPGATWIEIHYPGGPGNIGWVFADLVTLNGVTRDKLPTVQPPPTPTLQPTATPAAPITPGAPTEGGPTRLPTFTPPPQFAQPTLIPAVGESHGGGIPPALIIVIMFSLSVLGFFYTFLRTRR